MDKSLEITGELRARRTGAPKYSRLKTFLEGELAKDRLKPGDALPSELDLAANFAMSRSTVRQALAELQRDGLIRRVRGKGTYVEEQDSPDVDRDLDTFALIVNETREPAYTSLLHGFGEAMRKSHGQTIICGTENDLDKQGTTILQLLNRGIGGVAMVPTIDRPTPHYQIQPLQKQGIPVVFCHRGVEGVQAPLLPIRFDDVGRMAGEVLIKQGHSRVAFFSSNPLPNALDPYVQGLREALRAAGSDLPEKFTFCTTQPLHHDEEALKEGIERMCSEPDRPTGIVTTSDLYGETIYLMLQSLGLRVPQDISLVSEGGPLREGATIRKISSVIVPEEEIGRQAAKLLHQMCNGERPIYNTEEIVVPLRFYQGQTLGPPPEHVRCLATM